MKVLLEYIWLDGSEPQKLRSKTKVVEETSLGLDKIETYPDWSYDGSSTGQSEEGSITDCVLTPVYSCKDPFRGGNHRLVLCEVYEADGTTPHKTNQRVKLREMVTNLGLTDDKDKSELPWFGWEQEYTLMAKSKKEHAFSEGEGVPFGHEHGEGEPRKQGDYYCGIGADNVIGRDIVEEHMMKCLEVGIEVSGINAEVMLAQWEYQVGPVSPLEGSDQMWMSRYILERVAEDKGIKISYHPKPKSGKWNGSGCHVNFSTKEMRQDGGLKIIEESMHKLKSTHKEHIEVYGLYNDERMTGELETSDINKFSYDYSTRHTSIRIPVQTKNEGKGYFEDRRPSSNCDPYVVSLRMIDTIYNYELKKVAQ